jgi:hypothetical protein
MITYEANQVADTLEGMIDIIKAENPTLQIGNDDNGYTDLSKADYEKTILEWANARFNKIKKEEAKVVAKAAAEAKLAALGLSPDDLKALI